MTSGIRCSQGDSSFVPDAGNEGINFVVFVLSWGCWFSVPQNLQLFQREILGCAAGKGVVAEVVSWKPGALRSNPALFILGFLPPGEEKALGKPPVAKGGS